LADRSFLIAALSGRSLAAAAARAGHGTFVLDLFNDSDLTAIAVGCVRVDADKGGGFDGGSLLEATRRLECDEAPLVYGAGFEDRPELLGRLARGRTLCGNSPQTLARIKDPGDFFTTLDDLDIRHPEISLIPPENPPDDSGGWLVKPVGGSGGHHIRLVDETVRENGSADESALPAIPIYYQRTLAGRAISLLFLGDGARIRTLGVSQQHPAPFPPDHLFRFGFAVTLCGGEALLEAELTHAAAALTEAYGLVGLNSLDAIMDEAGELHVLEVNPRPGATLDIFDPLAGANLFDLHVAAVAGGLPHDSQVVGVSSDTARACAILYADASFKIRDGMDWPVWTADHPREETAFAAGDPVCTVFAKGETSGEALQTVMERTESLYRGLYGTAPLCVGVQTTDEKLRKDPIS